MEAAGITLDEQALRALMDRVVPGDDFPSASEAGGMHFLRRMLGERPDWVSRIAGLVATGDLAHEHMDWPWFEQLVSGGYYADESNGGNAGEASWRMIGWRPGPAGGWPVEVPVPESARTVVHPSALKRRYDAIVIGSGAGGGVASCGLAEQGRDVLVVEAGSWPSIAELASDHVRNPRSDWGVAPLSGPSNEAGLRILDGAGRRIQVRPSDPFYGNNALTAGGGTRVYGAQAWRFVPRDFRMATTYGVPPGSSLADWPITYEDLEPYYARAEWEIGVSGAGTDAHAGVRSRPYPMPPLPAGSQRDRLAQAASRLGWDTVPVPLLINSTPYLGRHACAQCSMCVGFACPVDAKNGSQNTMLTRAFATGRCAIVLEARAARLRTDPSGRVIGVSLVGAGSESWTLDVDAAEIVVAAGAVETARLLLNSTSDREPYGIGNGSDQVGRHLQGHVYGGATAIFADVVEELIGPGPSIATTDFRHGNPGLVGGGMIANEFVALPANIYRSLASSGLIPASGLDSKRGMRELALRMVRLMGPIQEVTSASSRVRVDPSVRDRSGVPVAVLSGSIHEEDRRARDFLVGRAAEWLREAGATEVVPTGAVSARGGVTRRVPGGAGQNTGDATGPSGGQHQAGTCRMGDDPATSVVDPYGRVWGHDNLRIADGSVHVTNGGVNPVLTIFATALRTIEHMAGGWATPADEAAAGR